PFESLLRVNAPGKVIVDALFQHPARKSNLLDVAVADPYLAGLVIQEYAAHVVDLPAASRPGLAGVAVTLEHKLPDLGAQASSLLRHRDIPDPPAALAQLWHNGIGASDPGVALAIHLVASDLRGPAQPHLYVAIAGELCQLFLEGLWLTGPRQIAFVPRLEV